ncbi:hypothetical protein IT417_02805 [bacterium]|nr:hypothetical protein [bacterium]
MDSIQDLISQKREELKEGLLKRKKHITTEHQDYGYRLALKLCDMGHKSLYMKLAKEKPRVLLEQAFSFAIDYPNATPNKGRLFMWKLKQLEQANGNTSKQS